MCQLLLGHWLACGGLVVCFGGERPGLCRGRGGGRPLYDARVALYTCYEYDDVSELHVKMEKSKKKKAQAMRALT